MRNFEERDGGWRRYSGWRRKLDNFKRWTRRLRRKLSGTEDKGRNSES